MIEPMLIAGIIIFLMFFWCGWKVYQMKKSFDERGGSYSPLIPEWMRMLK